MITYCIASAAYHLYCEAMWSTINYLGASTSLLILWLFLLLLLLLLFLSLYMQ